MAVPIRNMKKEYFVIYDLTDPNNVGVVCTDLDVASVGRSEAHARLMISEAVELHLEDAEEDGIHIPEEADSNKLLAALDQWRKDGIENFKVDKARFTIPDGNLKTRQIAVTISEGDLAEIDAWRKEHRIPRSRLLAKAALEFIHVK